MSDKYLTFVHLDSEVIIVVRRGPYRFKKKLIILVNSARI